jgi:signal transduction histidine kinase
VITRGPQPVLNGRSIATVSVAVGTSRFADFPSRRARWVASGVAAALVAVGLVRRLPDGSPAMAIAAAVIAVAACVELFRSGPRTLLPSAALATGGVAVVGHAMSSNIVWFTVCLISAWCVLLGRRRAGLIYWAITMTLFAAEWTWAQTDPGWGAWIAGTTLAALGAFLIRHEVALVSQLREAQAGLAQRAMAEERTRISRELHDVIAHTLTVSLLHVTSARLAVEYDPADAARSLSEAERLGRESLAEVRTAVGLLRQDGAIDAAPLPGADRLPSLVEQARLAGADVDLRTSGDLAASPATVGLTLYRILQESLTNAIKHAPGAAIRVDVCIDATRCTLTIDSAGTPGSGTGIGLLSMRERAESVGGTFQAGPGGRGWLVRTALPITARAQVPSS